MVETVILKLGGSVITDKSGNCSVDYDRLNWIASEIAERQADKKIIIIHGAGSCGHPEAKEHNLDKGLDPNDISGIFITHEAVSGLNDAVVNALRARGVEAVAIHPLGSCIANNGRLISIECGPIKLLTEHRIVPVLHGDVVMDLSRGACIVSGDQLVSTLPKMIPVDRIGLATDVAGLLDNGQVVSGINTGSINNLEIGESDNTDVTGGMKGKISELLILAENEVESNIFHVSRIGDFLDGRDHGGTVVTK